jgi:hypothetical protein
MKEDISTQHAVVALPAAGIGTVVREVWRLLKKGMEFSYGANTPLQTELRELAAPHMAVLVHKRAKVSAGRGMLDDEPWFGELSDFVASALWPHLRENEVLAGRSKNCVAELLDEIVAAEQRNNEHLALADIMPRTARFGNGWAG